MTSPGIMLTIGISYNTLHHLAL